MKRIRSFFLVALCVLAFAALMSACAGGNKDNKQEAEQKTVVDDAGHQVVMPAHPQRIVAPYLEDPLVVLGIKPIAQILYGNVEQNYLKDQLSDVDIIDTTDVGLPLEKLVELSPDLIIVGKGMASEDAYEQYAKIAPTYVIDNIDKNWRETLLGLADLLDKKQTAEEKLQAYDQKVEQAKEKIRQKVENKTAAIVVLTEKEFYTMGHVQGGRLLFDEVGVQPHRLTPSQEEWNTLSLEKLNELDADYIFIIKTERYQTSELERSSLWTSLTAVREGRTFEVESGIWQYSGLICNELGLADIVQAISGE